MLSDPTADDNHDPDECVDDECPICNSDDEEEEDVD